MLLHHTVSQLQGGRLLCTSGFAPWRTYMPVSTHDQRACTVDRVVADRPGIGRAPLFPKPEDPTRP